MVSRENKILVKEVDLGLSPYNNALKKQEKYFNIIIDQKIKNRKSTEKRKTSNFFLWGEHTPVITIGNRGNRNNLLVNEVELKDKKIELFNTNRGGDITLHSPGQLVGYPIFDLTKHKKDLHWFLRNIEQCIINTLSNFDLTCTRDDAGTGVWVNNSKIAAIGLSASKWVTMHGFSMNINPNLNYFDNIIPCGIENKTVTSLNKLMLDDNNVLDIHTIGNIVANEFSTAFDLELDFIEIDEMEMIHTLLDLNEIDIEMINEEQTIESFNIVREVGRK